jgi:hypothetical protein
MDGFPERWIIILRPLEEYSAKRTKRFPEASFFFVNPCGDRLPYTTVRFTKPSIAHSFVWRESSSPEKALLDLRNTNVGSLFSPEESWPTPGHLWIDNFSYDSLDVPTQAEAQLRWMQRAKPTDPFSIQSVRLQ